MRASYRALTCGAVTVLALLALCALCAIFLTNRYTGRRSCAPVSLAITGAQARERTDSPYRHLLLRCLRQGHDTAYGRERIVFGTTPARPKRDTARPAAGRSPRALLRLGATPHDPIEGYVRPVLFERTRFYLWLGQPIAQWLFARAEIGAGGPDGAAETDEPLPEILRFLTSAEAQQRWRSASYLLARDISDDQCRDAVHHARHALARESPLVVAIKACESSRLVPHSARKAELAQPGAS